MTQGAGGISIPNAWRRAVDLAEREAEEELGGNENLSLPIVIEIKHEDIRKARRYYQKLKKKSGRMCEKMLKEVEKNSSRVLERNEIPLAIELSVVEFESGVFAYHRGGHADARTHYKKAKKYKELAKDWRGLATVGNNLGAAVAKEGKNGQTEQAREEIKAPKSLSNLALSVLMRRSMSSPSSVRMQTWLEVL